MPGGDAHQALTTVMGAWAPPPVLSLPLGFGFYKFCERRGLRGERPHCAGARGGLSPPCTLWPGCAHLLEAPTPWWEAPVRPRGPHVLRNRPRTTWAPSRPGPCR